MAEHAGGIAQIATAFENVAKELRAAAGESSPTWLKAAAMGAQIDPANPLYGGAAGAAPAFEAAAPAPKPNLDFDLDSSSSAAAPAPAASSFDLDLGSEKPPQPDLPVSTEAPALDFDLGGGKQGAKGPQAAEIRVIS